MKGLDHNSTKNIEFEVVVFFSSVNLKKTMWLTPSNRLFACVVRVLCPIWISFKIGSIRSVPSLTWKISRSRIFPKNLIVLTEREKFNASSNIMTGVFQDILFFFYLTKLFFHFFQTWNCLDFCIFGPTKWIFMTLVLIFSKFGMYLTYKNRFWDHFSCFLGRCIYSTVWTRNGSKIDFQVWYLKG